MKNVRVTATLDEALIVARDLIYAEDTKALVELPIGDYRSPAEDDPEAWRLLGTG